MATIVNPYDSLYTSLKDKFTVVNGGCEYTVGDYMLMKAGKAKQEETALAVTVSENRVVANVISFVNERLTARTPAKKERTIKSFPLRTSMSAILSAVAASALVISCGIFSLVGKTTTVPFSASSENEIIVVEEIPETEKIEK